MAELSRGDPLSLTMPALTQSLGALAGHHPGYVLDGDHRMVMVMRCLVRHGMSWLILAKL